MPDKNGESVLDRILRKLVEAQRIEQTYAQGATQIYRQALQANCDKFSGAAMDFFMPEEIWRN